MVRADSGKPRRRPSGRRLAAAVFVYILVASLAGAGAAFAIDAVVSNNADVGINVTRSSFMLCEGCTVDENGSDGVRGLNGAQVAVFESTITDNGVFGVRALTSANATVVDSMIVGGLGVGGASRARVTGSNTPVTATGSVLGGAALGDLVCESGADATCDGSETKSSSSCSLCP